LPSRLLPGTRMELTSDVCNRSESWGNHRKQCREVDTNGSLDIGRAGVGPPMQRSTNATNNGALGRIQGQFSTESTGPRHPSADAACDSQPGTEKPLSCRRPTAWSDDDCGAPPARDGGGSSSSNCLARKTSPPKFAPPPLRCPAVTGTRSPRLDDRTPPAEGARMSLFGRRLPEEYSRLRNVESKLTTALRQQASQDESQHMAVRSVVQALGKSLLDSGKNAPLQLRVHLPPYDSEDSVVVVVVPLTMRVADLHGEVIRKHASCAHAVLSATCEVRLYDEDEGEPDYDSPPFDAHLQIGALNVGDVALCTVEKSASSDGHACQHQEDERTSTRSSMRRTSSVPTVPLLSEDFGGSDCTAETAAPREDTSDICSKFAHDFQSAALEGELGRADDRGNQRPLRKASDPVPCTHTADCARPVLSHRRTRSTPEKTAQGVQVITIGGFEGFKWTSSRAPAQEEPDAKSEDSIPPRGCSTSSVASASATRQLKLLLPKTGPANMATGITRDLSGASLGSDELSADSLITDGEFTIINVREDATLSEVLQKLSQQSNRSYDPINFAFERFDSGIWQRLDLDMQVKHLQTHSTALKVVSKDVPATLSPAINHHFSSPYGLEHRQPSSVRRRSPSSFNFSENTASIVTEYLVTITARNSRTRPVECRLIVDRERLCHQPPRGFILEKPEPKKGLFMPPLLKKLGKHLQLVESIRTDPNIFCERRVRDIESISREPSNHCAFSVVYSHVAGTTSELVCTELVYQAQTPTECAEIVARLYFLLALDS